MEGLATNSLKEKNPLPEGTFAVGAGLLVAGVTILAFLVISGRMLGPDRYAGLSTLWLSVFVAAPGFFLPVEQELARSLSGRHARGVGSGPLVRRAATLGVALLTLLLVATGAAYVLIRDELFRGDNLLVISFIGSLIGYFGAHLARGTLSGNKRFHAYGLLFGIEGVGRLVGCLMLATIGIKTAGAYGLLVAAAPFFATTIAVSRERDLITPGPDAPWSELSSNMSLLLAGSVLTQMLVNAAPLTVAVLADKGENELVGHFMAGVLVARVPLFMFQAVQAALLPKLAGLASAGQHDDFRTGLRRLLVVVSAIGVAGTVGAFALGPWVLRVVFGPEFDLGRSDLGYLAAGSAAFMLAVALGQSLIALNRHAQAVVGWMAGITAFVIVVALGSDLLLRAEQGFLAGACTAAVVMSGLTIAQMRRGIPDAADILLALRTTDLIEP